MAIAESIDLSIAQAQVVTVPVLDSRLASMEARIDSKIDAARIELIRWVFVVMLGNVALTTGAAAVLNQLQR